MAWKKMFAVFLLLFGLAFPIIWYFLFWQYLLNNPEVAYANDFLIQYTAGQILNKMGGHFLYDPQAQLAIQQQIIPRDFFKPNLLPFNHPPLLAPLLFLITKLPYLAAYKLWAGVQFILWAGCLWIIKSKWIEKSISPWKQLIFLFSLSLFYPAFIAILKGQDSMFVLLPLFVWLIALIQRRYILAGIALALCLLRPQIALALAIPFIFTQPRMWWSFVVTAGFLSGYSLALVGVTGVHDYLSILSATAQNSQYIINQEAMVNFIGMMLRLFPDANPATIQTIGWGMYFLSIIFLSYSFKRNWRTYNHTQNRSYLLWLIALSIPCVLFFSPYLHYHDLVLTLVPMLIIINLLSPSQEKTIISTALVISIATLLLLFCDLLTGHWRFSGVYLFFVSLIIGIGLTLVKSSLTHRVVV